MACSSHGGCFPVAVQAPCHTDWVLPCAVPDISAPEGKPPSSPGHTPRASLNFPDCLQDPSRGLCSMSSRPREQGVPREQVLSRTVAENLAVPARWG